MCLNVEQWMKFVCVDVILGCRVSALYSYKWLSNGQDVRNGGHYKTINRWREPIRVIISEKMRPTWSWLKMICCGNSWVQSKSFIKLVFVSVLSIQLHIQIEIHRVHKKTRKFVFWPNSKSIRVSFEICSFWGFQNWPNFWYLAK